MGGKKKKGKIFRTTILRVGSTRMGRHTRYSLSGGGEGILQKQRTTKNFDHFVKNRIDVIQNNDH